MTDRVINSLNDPSNIYIEKKKKKKKTSNYLTRALAPRTTNNTHKDRLI